MRSVVQKCDQPVQANCGDRSPSHVPLSRMRLSNDRGEEEAARRLIRLTADLTVYLLEPGYQ
jgi:hypothetical protein